ncbi:MAG: TldD/PmbA family protein [Nitrospira sp.]|nr:TldD/PmbA family protein [Nitrospira sp.]MDH4236494.1 TldD/PmbA family protein [Nitrospira sp.]MDH4326901.1 TldD/PmbA family protein [Nitrospira sp.]MDH5253140.1 TldD/PmbA family protein [Nitrospira sp.]MDH5624499.1 TldD/PmbA family protein [Nitrospira sp.]
MLQKQTSIRSADAVNGTYNQLAADVLARAKDCGATEADIVVADGETFSLQVRVGAVDRLTKAREKRLGLRVFVGKRSATTSTSDFSRESLERLVSETCTLAKAVVEDPVSGLPDASQMAQDWPDLDLYDGTILSTETQIEWAKRGEAAAFAADSRVTNSEGAEFDSSSGRVVLANSHGFVGSYKSSSYSLSVSPIATEPETGAMQRDAWYEVQRKFSRLASAESIGQEAARRAVRRLGARKVATKRVPVVFDQETAGSLLANLCSAVSGYGLYKRASFLLDQLGQTIASNLITVYDDGRMAGGLGSRPFDGEGLATSKNTIVERGVLKSYLLDTYSGKKLGLSSTGNASRSVGESPSVGPTNFYLLPGVKSPQDIIGSVKEGLYVTDLIGFGINMVTGDYSRGACGFWIENGELTYPVEEITIAGNLKEMFKHIEMVGSDLVFRGRIASPTVKITEMMVAGN